MCGIAGASGPNINKDKLSLLFIANDTRGGDSCGFYDVDGLITFMEGKRGTFLDCLAKFQLNVKGNLIIGHARAASPGVPVVKENAHPFIVDSIVGTHNGIIRNFRTLCDKYKVKSHESDSKSLFTIIASLEGNKKKIAELLGSYTGAAALAWIDENNHLCLYRGESRKYEDAVTIYEERPLFIGKIGGTLYYSSIENSLRAIGAKPWKDNSFEIDGNTVYIFDNGVLLDSFTVDRSKATMEYPVYPKSLTTHQKTIPFQMTSTKTSSASGIVDKLLSDVRKNPDGGKVYLSGGLYYRNGHILGNRQIETLYLDSDGSIYHPKEVVHLQENYYKITTWQLRELTVRKCNFYRGHLFVDDKALDKFLAEDYDATVHGIKKFRMQLDSYFLNPVRTKSRTRLNIIDSYEYALDYWLINPKYLGKNYVKEGCIVTLPFNNGKHYFFKAGDCVSVSDPKPIVEAPPVTVELDGEAEPEITDENKFEEEITELLIGLEDTLIGYKHLETEGSTEIKNLYSAAKSAYEELENIVLTII